MQRRLRQNVQMLLRLFCHLLGLCSIMLAACNLRAAELDSVAATAEHFVRLQTQGLPGKVQLTIGKLDLSRLPPCTTHEAFLPPGTNLSGRTHIGVRCLAPTPWSVLLPVKIAISGDYVTTSRPLIAGQAIAPGDLNLATGDLASLPAGVITNPQAAIGKTLRQSLGAGQPLRSDQLLAPLVIRQGQSVRVIVRGRGFSATAEGRALNNAAEGQLAQVRMTTGQTVSGIATADGSVEISN